MARLSDRFGGIVRAPSMRARRRADPDLAGRDVAGDDRAGRGHRARAHVHRRDEQRVAAQRGVVVHDRAALGARLGAVIDRDRARADVHARADVGVANVAESGASGCARRCGWS